MMIQTFNNSGQGSHFRNECGGFFMTTIEQPSPGFYVMERWKDIPGYKGLYLASSLGRIKSLKRYHEIRNHIATIIRPYGGIILKDNNCSNGYSGVSLCKNGKRKRFSVHRLVALAFIPNPENKPCINHIDANKKNNHISNIEWCTYMENTDHAIKNKLVKYVHGEKVGTSKLNEFQVRVIRNCSDLFNRELAEIFNISTTGITLIKNRKRWTYLN